MAPYAVQALALASDVAARVHRLFGRNQTSASAASEPITLLGVAFLQPNGGTGALA